MSNEKIDKEGLLLEETGKKKEAEDLEDLFDLAGKKEETKTEVKTETKTEEKVEEKPKEEKPKEESAFLKGLKDKPEEVIGKLVKERLDRELDERDKKRMIAKDIKEIDSMPDMAENKKVILDFMKKNPMLSDGFIAEAHKKGENPLKNILNYANSQKGGEETEVVSTEEAPETAAPAATGEKATGKLTPEDEIGDSIVSVKKKGEGESIFSPG